MRETVAFVVFTVFYLGAMCAGALLTYWFLQWVVGVISRMASRWGQRRRARRVAPVLREVPAGTVSERWVRHEGWRS